MRVYPMSAMRRWASISELEHRVAAAVWPVSLLVQRVSLGANVLGFVPVWGTPLSYRSSSPLLVTGVVGAAIVTTYCPLAGCRAGQPKTRQGQAARRTIQKELRS